MTTKQLDRLLAIREACARGAALRRRVDAGASQSEVAVAAGVSRSAVAAWESGRRRPRGDGALRYLAVLEHIGGAL